MADDYQPQRPNSFVDIPDVSDTTVQAMLADLKAAGKVAGDPEWPSDPGERTRLRLQIVGYFWRAFGRPVWVRGE
jgi:hypothetical protein